MSSMGNGERDNALRMTPRKHGASIASKASDLIFARYMAGQEEHGGELWRKPGLLDEAIEESIDLVVYLLTLKDQLTAE